MTESILNDKKVLAVDDEPDVLDSLEELISVDAPRCILAKATCYEDAVALLEANDYDLVILDIMGVRGFDLLELAVQRRFKVAMLTAHALTPEALKRSYDMKAYAFLPKEKLADILVAWREGMRRPLPLAAKSAFAWLKAGDASAALKVYEGGFNQKGEVETDPYLARAYPDFAALTASGEFADLAETLLRPLYEAMPADKRKPGKSRPSQAPGDTA